MSLFLKNVNGKTFTIRKNCMHTRNSLFIIQAIQFNSIGMYIHIYIYMHYVLAGITFFKLFKFSYNMIFIRFSWKWYHKCFKMQKREIVMHVCLFELRLYKKRKKKQSLQHFSTLLNYTDLLYLSKTTIVHTFFPRTRKDF